MYKDRLDHLNTEKQARLEILSQSRKDLQTQVARIRQSLEKVLDKKERIFGRKNSYLISSTGHNHIFNIDCPFDDYLNNCSCHYKCLWGGEEEEEEDNVLHQKIKQASRCTQKTCWESC